MAKAKTPPSGDVEIGTEYIPAEPAKRAGSTPPDSTGKSAKGPTSGSEWDDSKPRVTPSVADPVETALRKSGVTQAMIDFRNQYRARTRELLASSAPAPYGAGGKALLGPLNVVATSFGQKWSDGRPTGKRGVLVMVRTKADVDQVHSQMLVPPHESVKGEKVFFDVVEVGQPRLGGYQTSEDPADFGASISTATGLTGSIGCRVFRNPSDGFPDGQKCILSNNHILANVNQASIGTEILQPGIADAGGGQHKIAQLVRFVPLNFSDSPLMYSAPNRVDAALAWTSAKHCAARFHNDIPFDPTLIDCHVGMQVIKEGRTSGYTEGTINGLDADPNIPYGEGTGPYGYFTGQIQIVGNNGLFSQPGDSGSFILGLADDGLYHPVGLLFAGSTSGFTWANPIQWVFQDLDIGNVQYNPDETPGG